MIETDKPTLPTSVQKSEPVIILLIHLGIIFMGQLLLLVLLQSTMQFILLQDKIPTEEMVGKSFDEISQIQKDATAELVTEFETQPEAVSKKYYNIIFLERQGVLFWSSLMWVLAFLLPGYLILSRWLKIPISKLEDKFQLNQIAAGALAGIGIFGIVSLVGMFLILIDLKPENNEFQTMLFKNLQGNSTLLAWSVYSVGLFTGLIEEWFFRGMLLKHFVSKGLVREGWIITSILFGALHFSPEASMIIPVILSGVGAYFGYLYIRTGNIWVPITAHAVYNSITLILAFFLGDQIT
jgi:uncharacterized protein